MWYSKHSAVRRPQDTKRAHTLRRALWLAWGAIVLVAALPAGSAGAQSDAVDVSGYPPEIQRDYRVFVDKCSRCHALTRPLRATYSTTQQWREVIARMARLPGAAISRQDQDAVLRFLVARGEARAAERAKERGVAAPPAAGGAETAAPPARPPTSVSAAPIVVTREGVRIEAVAHGPQPVHRLRGGRWVEEGPRGDETLYLAVRVIDAATGEKLPYARVTARVLGPGAGGGATTLAPGFDLEGFHYGANLAAPRGRCRIALTIDPPALNRVADAAPRLTQTMTVEMDLFR